MGDLLQRWKDDSFNDMDTPQSLKQRWSLLPPAHEADSGSSDTPSANLAASEIMNLGKLLQILSIRFQFLALTTPFTSRCDQPRGWMVHLEEEPVANFTRCIPAWCFQLSHSATGVFPVRKQRQPFQRISLHDAGHGVSCGYANVACFYPLPALTCSRSPTRYVLRSLAN
eukprot:768012-Hanusia_phi.AAC.10